MMYQNVCEKIPQTSVSIMSPCNNPDLKLGPLILVRIFLFWDVYNTTIMLLWYLFICCIVFDVIIILKKKTLEKKNQKKQQTNKKQTNKQNKTVSL